MCGIAGIIGLDRRLDQDDFRVVREMSRVLHHRGPDARGFSFDAHCALGNTRLKVIDLSASANLPISTPDGNVVLCYNGEVTNFRELNRKYDLESKHRFRTKSDSETLLYLYEELGIDFLHELTGMFAFCLYDKRSKKAWLVRDFYGIRPLFYMRAEGRFYFASEIKALLEPPCFEPRLDLVALYDFLSLAYIPEERTPFEMIRELGGGRVVEIDLRNGETSERSYYELRYEPDFSLTERDLVGPLYEQLKDSVRRNLVSDAPVGITYSGGFDTSTILALARELRGEKEVETFSIVMGEKSYDESRYQYEMVDPRSPTHHEVRVGPQQVFDALVEHMAFMDEPSGDGAAIPSYLLAREASKSVTVLLSGEGGDETFNAYETHLAYKVRKLYRRFVPAPVRSAARTVASCLPCDYRKLSFDFRAKRFTEGAELSVPEAHLFWRYSFKEEDKRALMPECRLLRPTSKLFTDLYESLDFPEGLDRISVMDLKHYFIGDLMVKNDRTMMAHSIEARFPLMDRILMDFVRKIPVDLRIRGFTRRYIQKQAMKGHVPDAIYRRKNMGLEMPHSIWFLNELRPLADRYFSKKSIERTDFLDSGAVAALWAEHVEHRRDNGRGLWCLLNLLVWYELFVYDRSYKQFLPSVADSRVEWAETPG